MKASSSKFKTDKVTASFIEEVLLRTNPKAFVRLDTDGTMTIMNLESSSVNSDDDGTIHITEFFEKFLDNIICNEDGTFTLIVGSVTYELVKRV